MALLAVVVALRGIHLADLKSALATARWGPVVAAALIGLGGMNLARIGRWAALLAPLPHATRPTFLDLFHLVSAGNFANNVLPARAGEAMRAYAVHRRHGYSAGAAIASGLLDKLVEVVSLGLLAVGVAFAGPLPGIARPVVSVLGAVALSGLACAVVVGWRLGGAPEEQHGRVRAFLQRLGHAVRLMSHPRAWAVAVGWSLIGDLCDVAMVGLCLRAVHIELAPRLWVVLYLAINVAIAIPATPAQIGLLEAGATIALQALGVPVSRGLAFALLYHAVQIVPATLIGFFSLQRTTRDRAWP